MNSKVIKKTSLGTSTESQIYWKKQFQKKPLYFRIIADFETDNETDTSSIGNKVTNFYKQNPVCNGYYMISELEHVLKNGYFFSDLDFDVRDCIVCEVRKVENKIPFCFKNTDKDIIMTQEDEEDYRKKIICRFCEKKLFGKVRDHCHLTGKNRSAAQNNFTNNVTQEQNVLISFALHNFVK